MKVIKVPAVTWVLGDREQATVSGVTTTTRPLYYRPTGATGVVRIGSINPDYAEPLMTALEKDR